jgi:hypothetical protein
MPKQRTYRSTVTQPGIKVSELLDCLPRDLIEQTLFVAGHPVMILLKKFEDSYILVVTADDIYNAT